MPGLFIHKQFLNDDNNDISSSRLGVTLLIEQSKKWSWSCVAFDSTFSDNLHYETEIMVACFSSHLRVLKKIRQLDIDKDGRFFKSLKKGFPHGAQHFSKFGQPPQFPWTWIAMRSQLKRLTATTYQCLCPIAVIGSSVVLFVVFVLSF